MTRLLRGLRALLAEVMARNDIDDEDIGVAFEAHIDAELQKNPELRQALAKRMPIWRHNAND